MRRSDMEKGDTFEAVKQGPQIKTGRPCSRDTGGHPHLHQEDGVCPPQSSTPHTHISRTPPHLLDSKMPLSCCQGDRNTGFLTDSPNKSTHSFSYHSLTPSFLPSHVCTSIHWSHLCPIHSSSNSDYLLANPCMHSFMLLTDLNIKSISFINSVNSCNKHLLCARHCLRLRGHRKKQSS